jgi:methyltransferase
VSATAAAYLCLLAAVACERALEVTIARRNLASVLARGGVVVERRTYRVAVAVQVAWLAACAAEVLALRRPLIAALAAPMLLLLAAAMALRYASVRALGDRWTMAIALVPGEPLVTAGPYRWTRHPNYLAVAVEGFALPLVHTAWLTAALLGPAIVLLAMRRGRIEERALANQDHAATERLPA